MLTNAEMQATELARDLAGTYARLEALEASHRRMVHISMADHWDDPEVCAQACPYWRPYPFVSKAPKP